MIVYHPRSDIYHCMFRLINIVNCIGMEEFEHSRLRIYDMFFLFPHFIKDIEFPRAKGVSNLKKKANLIPHPYENLPDKKRLFSELGDYQIQAIQILLAKNIFIEENGVLRKSDGFENTKIKDIIYQKIDYDQKFFISVINVLNSVEISGNTGLKKRTGLMEYRYDAV